MGEMGVFIHSYSGHTPQNNPLNLKFYINFKSQQIDKNRAI